VGFRSLSGGGAAAADETPVENRSAELSGIPTLSRMPYVYMLRCADGTLYVGSTLDLARRLEQHQAGEGAAYTKRRLPVELLWCAQTDRIDEAFGWEKRLQGWSHAKRLAFAEGGLDAVKGWSRREREGPTGR